MRLADLPFTDLAVQAEPEACRAKTRGRSLELEVLPNGMWPELRDLHEALSDKKVPRFLVDFHGLRLRAQRRETQRGPVFMVRRVERQVRELDDLRLAPSVAKQLRDPELRSGLVIFCGPPAAGKTTAACAMLLARMREIGGFTWTAENPVEYDLQGVHGKGQCYQEDIAEDTEIGRVFADTLRSSADTFYIGEIRETSAATVAELASASGMLVVSTLHAETVQQAVLKLGLLGNWQSLAQSLRVVISMRLERRAASAGGSESILRTQPLVLDPRSKDDEIIRTKIRQGDVAKLADDLERQRLRFLATEQR
ncbi:MAG: Flp pilus assembly complex ATPase component TadA [Burkholderiales bacterium]|nr:Flp pilus assembly complex ATPase component TadA [Burkholderiales bacterium]